MRFMMIVKASHDSEAGVFPSRELVAAMGRYNEELIKAGALLAADGLQPSSKGARVTFSGSKPTVTDGPFPETEQLVAGFWLIQANSKDEVVQWACRVPFEDGEVEIRQLYEESDFPADVLPPEEAERERAMREQLRNK
jgi:Uncharacterized protein conserved in bacteria